MGKNHLQAPQNMFKSSRALHVLCVCLKTIGFFLVSLGAGALLEVVAFAPYMLLISIFGGWRYLILLQLLLSFILAKFTSGPWVTVTVDQSVVTITQGRRGADYHLNDATFAFQKAQYAQDLLRKLVARYEIKIIGNDGQVTVVNAYAFSRATFLNMGSHISSLSKNPQTKNGAQVWPKEWPEEWNEDEFESILLNTLCSGKVFTLKSRILNQLTHCQKCGHTTYWKKSRLWCWITVLFVPLFPVSTRQIKVCTACHQG